MSRRFVDQLRDGDNLDDDLPRHRQATSREPQRRTVSACSNCAIAPAASPRGSGTRARTWPAGSTPATSSTRTARCNCSRARCKSSSRTSSGSKPRRSNSPTSCRTPSNRPEADGPPPRLSPAARQPAPARAGGMLPDGRGVRRRVHDLSGGGEATPRVRRRVARTRRLDDGRGRQAPVALSRSWTAICF